MNISKNKKIKVFTKDRHLIKGGEKIYWWCHNFQIRCCIVKHWHDGIFANMYFPTPGRKPCFVNVKGYGGKGIYPEDELNVFSFIPARLCYFDLNKLLKARERKIKKILKNQKVTFCRTRLQK